MKTYEQKDATRKPVEWNGLNTIMLGTISEAGIVRRMDGTRVTVEHREANPDRLCTFATRGKWEFEKDA